MTSGTFIRKKEHVVRGSSVDFKTIQVAKVKSTDDFTHNGKLWVWLVSSNTNENLQENWFSVIYASPFAGSTDPNAVDRQATQSFSGTQKSYGFFAVPPDLNNFVLVGFANGDENQGYWFSCLYKDTLTHMIPGISSGKSFSSNGPLAEMNVYSAQSSSNPKVNPLRPIYEPLFNGLTTQGLINDPLRGAGTSSVWRDNTPSVQGWLTPGGNQLIFDDKADAQLIRIRTKSGAQVLISETDGSIYAISRDGKSWLELNNNGNIDMYSGGSISMRADDNINISAGNGVFIQTDSSDINIKSGGGTNISSQSNTNMGGSGTLLLGGSQIHLNGPSPTPANSVPRKPTHEPFER